MSLVGKITRTSADEVYSHFFFLGGGVGRDGGWMSGGHQRISPKQLFKRGRDEQWQKLFVLGR